MDENLNENQNTPEDNDDFVIGKGFLPNVDEQSPDQNEGHLKKRGKGKSVIKTALWIIAIFAVSIGLAFGIIFAGADYMGIGFGRGENCVIEIEQGMSTKQIASELKECGAIKCPLLFRVYAKLKHYDSAFKYGVYNFNNEAGYESLSQMLMNDGAKADSVTVTVPEMSTVDEIADILEKAGVCSKKDFISAVQTGEFDYDFIKEIPEESVYYRLEGYLFPDTYDFYCYDSEECAYLAVDKMLKTLDSKLDGDMKAKISESKYSFHELMTMASIVELEAGGSVTEMPNVAAVFFNRLESDDFQKLESSPTVKYPHGGGRYDTYQCKGLPPGPLCSPSLNSVKAALNPTKDFDYYYFVTDASMKFYYNKTLAEHNSTIARLKKENNWIGDK